MKLLLREGFSLLLALEKKIIHCCFRCVGAMHQHSCFNMCFISNTAVQSLLSYPQVTRNCISGRIFDHNPRQVRAKYWALYFPILSVMPDVKICMFHTVLTLHVSILITLRIKSRSLSEPLLCPVNCQRE